MYFYFVVFLFSLLLSVYFMSGGTLWGFGLKRCYIHTFTYLIIASRSHNDKLDKSLRQQRTQHCCENWAKRSVFGSTEGPLVLSAFYDAWGLDFEGGNSDSSLVSITGWMLTVSALYQIYVCHKEQPVLNPFINMYLKRTDIKTLYFIKNP